MFEMLHCAVMETESQNTANTLFTIAFRRLMNGWSVIRSFRQVANAGLPYAREAVHQQNDALVKYLDFRRLFKRLDNKQSDASGDDATRQWFTKALTDQAISNAVWSIDAASLVFAHSVLDELLADYVQLSALVSRDYWNERIAKKKVPIPEIRAEGYECVTQTLINQELETLRRNASLLEKATILMAICKPKSGSHSDGYLYDEAA
jgi:hypothetical protein